jgi:hypothetical protein
MNLGLSKFKNIFINPIAHKTYLAIASKCSCPDTVRYAFSPKNVSLGSRIGEEVPLIGFLSLLICSCDGVSSESGITVNT